jgi:hypothetical protein
MLQAGKWRVWVSTLLQAGKWRVRVSTLLQAGKWRFECQRCYKPENDGFEYRRCYKPENDGFDYRRCYKPENDGFQYRRCYKPENNGCQYQCCYKPENNGFQYRRCYKSEIRISMLLFFLSCLILAAELWPTGLLSLEQKWVPEDTSGVKRGRHVSLIASPLSMSLLFRYCGILDVSQRYRPQRPVTGIALLSIFTFYFIFRWEMNIQNRSPNGDAVFRSPNANSFFLYPPVQFFM